MLRIIKIMADYNKDVVADRERDRHPMATNDGEFEDYETRMSDVIRDGYENCDPERWLKVIPQLIANIDMQYVNTLAIFCSIGEQHAQGILFSLIFAQKNCSGGREKQRKNAADVIDKIRDHSRTLVEEVETLTRELVSVSMLWGDIWNEAIDFVSIRIYDIKNKFTARLDEAYNYLRDLKQKSDFFTSVHP